MLRKFLSRRPSHTTVVAYLSLFLVLGGGAAYAADTIGSSDVIDESLLSQDFKDGEVRNSDLRANSVGTGKVIDNTLTGADVDDGSLAAPDLANGAVTRTKLGFQAIDQDAMDNDSVAGNEIVNSSVRSEDIGLAQVGSSDIASGAVEADELDTIAQRTKTINVAGSAIDGDRAACNAGEQVISGGARANPGPLVRILDSYRDGNGWTVVVRNETFRDNVVSLEIYAYCLVP